VASSIDPRIGVVGATGVVGAMTLALLAARGYRRVRAFASYRSTGQIVSFGGDTLVVEHATAETLAAGDLDFALFSVGSRVSSQLVPAARDAGAICIDKSSAFRLHPGIPLVVPEVNGDRAEEHDGIVANPNCCAIPLSCVLKPFHEAAGLAGVQVATYQSASGAGMRRMERMRELRPEEHDLAMDWEFDGVELEEETKLRDETRKILELPDVPISAMCVRVPVLIGHAEAVWLELKQPLSAGAAREVLAEAPGVQLEEFPTPRKASGKDAIFVGRVREDAGRLLLFLACDNLRKGAALNAIQIAELLLARRAIPA
jgi:aspartate-semialdehyde dehydrogenase